MVVIAVARCVPDDVVMIHVTLEFPVDLGVIRSRPGNDSSTPCNIPSS
jgi:hypothetical protein